MMPTWTAWPEPPASSSTKRRSAQRDPANLADDLQAVKKLFYGINFTPFIRDAERRAKLPQPPGVRVTHAQPGAVTARWVTVAAG
jgi:hypothetical protein